jgi:carotenoid cleavage dioxygenase-like enzyme
MPRFFFHLTDGVTVCDEQGLVFDSIEDARVEAIRTAREIMSHEVREGALPITDRIIIADEQGNSVMAIPFSQAVKVVESEE